MAKTKEEDERQLLDYCFNVLKDKSVPTGRKDRLAKQLIPYVLVKKSTEIRRAERAEHARRPRGKKAMAQAAAVEVGKKSTDLDGLLSGNKLN